MKKEEKKLELHGSNRQKAKQLKKIIQQAPLSKKELDAILPFDKEFYKFFIEAFHTVAKKEAQGYETYVKAMSNTMSNLTNMIPNEKIDAGTRKEIIGLIARMSKDLSKGQTNTTVESEKTNRWIVGVLGVLGLAALIIFGVRKSPNTGETIH